MSEGTFWPLLNTALSCILEVFVVCLSGWILAQQKILDKRTQKRINSVNVALFTPALLFSKVAYSMSPEKLIELWVIPVIFVVVTAVSGVVAAVMSWMFRLKRSQKNFAMAASMFSNTNSLPIALMQSLAMTVKELKWGRNDDRAAMVGRALTYLILYSTFGMMLRFSYGIHLLSQTDDDETSESSENDPLLPANTNATRSISRYNSLENNDVPTIAIPRSRRKLKPSLDIPSDRLTALRSEISQSGVGSSQKLPLFFHSFPGSPIRTPDDSRDVSPHRSRTHSRDATSADREADNDECDTWRRPIDDPPQSGPFSSFVCCIWSPIVKTFQKINRFLTIPTWAGIAALFVACVPPLQRFLEGIGPLKRGLISTGDCSIPLALVVLGSYFYTDPQEKDSSDAEVTPPSPVIPNQGFNGPSGYGTISRHSIQDESTPHSPDTYVGHGSPERASSPCKTGAVETGSVPGETRTVFVACVSRMIITPAILLPAVSLMADSSAQKVFADPVFIVSNVLLVSAPPALTLAQMSQAGSGDTFERLISRTIFWAYCILTPPLTIACVLIGLQLARF